jgi:flagellar operon protein
MVDQVGSASLPDAIRRAGPVDQAGQPGVSAGARSGQVPDGVAFGQILQQQLQPGSRAVVPVVIPSAPVRFSAHAQQRLAQAAVELNSQALAKLEAAVDRAGQKGGKESLILLDDLAFVVSVRNRTVITAVGTDRMADSVFTNIDSVVIARQSEPDPQGELAPPTE